MNKKIHHVPHYSYTNHYPDTFSSIDEIEKWIDEHSMITSLGVSKLVCVPGIRPLLALIAVDKNDKLINSNIVYKEIILEDINETEYIKKCIYKDFNKYGISNIYPAVSKQERVYRINFKTEKLSEFFVIPIIVKLNIESVKPFNVKYDYFVDHYMKLYHAGGKE